MPLTFISPTKAVDLSRPEYHHLTPYNGPIALGRPKHVQAAAPRPPAKPAATKVASPVPRSATAAPAAAPRRTPAPTNWTDALDAGYANSVLRGFVTAGVLPDPRELQRTGRLAWEGRGVWNELERRGLLGW